MDIIEEVNEYYKNFNKEKGIYGKSVKGNPLYYLRVYKSPYPKMIITYSIHGREYITSYLALKQIDYFADNGKYGDVYFLPLTNPDGVYISLYSDKLNKANYNGVDLNVNFDAKWGTGRSNVRKRGRENYIGEYPFSEPETIFLKAFTIKIKPDVTISYHSKGEEIYYNFGQVEKVRKRDYKVAERISKITGYKIKDTPYSAGGYKDWCIEKLNITALTIECGSDKLSHPIGKENIDAIYDKNREVICSVTALMKEMKDG